MRNELAVDGGLWWAFVKLRYAIGDDFPGRFRADEYMSTDFYLRITVYASQGNPVNIALKYTAEGRATTATELKTESVRADK